MRERLAIYIQQMAVGHSIDHVAMLNYLGIIRHQLAYSDESLASAMTPIYLLHLAGKCDRSVAMALAEDLIAADLKFNAFHRALEAYAGSL